LSKKRQEKRRATGQAIFNLALRVGEPTKGCAPSPFLNQSYKQRPINKDFHMRFIHFATENKPQQLDLKSNPYCQVDAGTFFYFCLAYAIN